LLRKKRGIRARETAPLKVGKRGKCEIDERRVPRPRKGGLDDGYGNDEREKRVKKQSSHPELPELYGQAENSKNMPGLKKDRRNSSIEGSL